MKDHTEMQELLQAKAHYGFTKQGSAIVAVEWFNQSFRAWPESILAAVLIYNIEEVYKCYLGVAVGNNQREQILFVAENGCKLPPLIAIAIFPGKFETEMYDKP
jgi:hypothetical protein